MTPPRLGQQAVEDEDTLATVSFGERGVGVACQPVNEGQRQVELAV